MTPKRKLAFGLSLAASTAVAFAFFWYAQHVDTAAARHIETAARHSLLFELVPTPTLQTDEQGWLTAANQAAEEMLGLDTSKLRTVKVSALFTDQALGRLYEDRLRQTARQLRQQGSGRQVTCRTTGEIRSLSGGPAFPGLVVVRGVNLEGRILFFVSVRPMLLAMEDGHFELLDDSVLAPDDYARFKEAVKGVP